MCVNAQRRLASFWLDLAFLSAVERRGVEAPSVCAKIREGLMRYFMSASAALALLLVSLASSWAGETGNLQQAIENTRLSIEAGVAKNKDAMLDNLESARDFAVYAHEGRPVGEIKTAIDDLGEAISHTVADHLDEAVYDARQALAHLKKAQ